MEVTTTKQTSKKGRSCLIWLLSFATLIGIFTVGIVVGQSNLLSTSFTTSLNSSKEALLKNTSSGEDVDFTTFWKVWRLVNENHVNAPFDGQKLMFGAIKGMVEATGDPHSSFWDIAETKEFTNWVNNAFYGIGVEIEKKGDQLVILNVLEGTPAKQADLKVGDVIVMINTDSTLSMSLNEAVIRIRGEKGSKLSLTVVRDGAEVVRELVRDIVKVDSVRWKMDGDIVYLEVLHFGDDTDSGFDKAIADFMPKNPKGIVLDLRNNGGGYLEAAKHLAGTFFKDGIIMQEEEKGVKTPTIVDKVGPLVNVPVVVLINKYSASASEILAGAIKDRKRGLLVGETSFGKGTIQNVENLSDGSSLRLTFAYWLLPSGVNINGKGIEPDISVPWNEVTPQDEQYDKAFELLRSEQQVVM